MFILAVGNFLTGQQLKDPPEIQDVLLGIGKKIYCPEHTYTHPVRYLWAYVNKKGRPKIIAENRKMMMLDHGKVLFLSTVTRAKVNEINNNGGVACMLHVKSKGMLSRRIKLKIVGEG